MPVCNNHGYYTTHLCQICEEWKAEQRSRSTTNRMAPMAPNNDVVREVPGAFRVEKRGKDHYLYILDTETPMQGTFNERRAPLERQTTAHYFELVFTDVRIRTAAATGSYYFDAVILVLSQDEYYACDEENLEGYVDEEIQVNRDSSKAVRFLFRDDAGAPIAYRP